MSKAVMYTKPSCPFCVKAKELLNSRGVAIEEHVFGVSPQAIDKDAIEKAVGREVNTVPQIMLDEGDGLTYIGGYSELVAHFGDSV